jgi:hypothetical protein
MFDRGMVHTVVAGNIVDHYHLRFVRGVIHIVVAGYNVDQHYNITNQNNMNHSCLKPQTVIGNNITTHNNMNHSSVKIKQ